MKRRHLQISLLLLLQVFVINQGIQAQNTGPAAPEAMSFEPVDATDMVDLLTGDFTYVLPLLEVPGPEGGYPVVLSYHAGITTDQEASWVGLGWNINPGAINRRVRSYPDDWKNKEDIVVMYDDGEKNIQQYYLNYAQGNYYSIGLYKSFQSFKSLGTGSVGSNSGNGTSSNSTSGTGIQNFSAGLSISMSSGSSKTLSADSKALLSRLYNYQPTNKDINFRRYIYRHDPMVEVTDIWYLHKDKYVNRSGVLYTKDAIKQKEGSSIGIQASNYAMDVYELSMLQWSLPFSEHDDNFMFPAYDNYSISAQGLSGNMTPRLLSSGLLVNTYKDGEYSYKTLNENAFDLGNENIYFYFDDNNSYFRNIPGDPIGYGDNVDNYSVPVTLNTSVNINGVNYDGYHATKKRLQKGKHIEWFKNSDLVNPTSNTYQRGFIETSSITTSRSQSEYFDPDGIGAISITKEDGLTYHYSLPVYQFEEVLRDEGGFETYVDFVENRRLDKYAYTWLLTGITGPDFIDNGSENGVIDEYDYGYWVTFDYGKWTDGYIWQAPSSSWEYYVIGEIPFGSGDRQKYHRKIAWGRKQIYYLNSIKTRTHTAYFVKSVRNDGLGAEESFVEFGDIITNEISGKIMFGLTEKGWYKEGTTTEWPGYSRDFSGTDYYYNETNIPNARHKVLKLEKIILVSNDAPEISPVNTTNLISNPNSWSGTIAFSRVIEDINCGYYPPPQGFSNGDNLVKQKSVYSKSFNRYFQDLVIDVKDIPANYEDNAIKVIEMKTNYSLCNSTPNSTLTGNTPNSLHGGKLTLNGVGFYGENGIKSIPDYNFSYNKLGNNRYNLGNSDKWGYDEHTDNWSLKEIESPLGGKMLIEYEEDSYSIEAYARFAEEAEVIAYTPERYNGAASMEFPEVRFSILYHVEFAIGVNVSELFKPGEYVLLTALIHRTFSPIYWSYQPTNNHLDDLYLGAVYVKSINSDNTVTFFAHDQRAMTPNHPDYVNISFSYTDEAFKRYEMEEYSYIVTNNIERNHLGGGIRVKELSLDNDGYIVSSKKYSYIDTETGLSSGVTSYSPTTDPKNVLFKDIVPGSKVLYKKVKEERLGHNNQLLDCTEYEFEVLKPWDQLTNWSPVSIDPYDVYIKEVDNQLKSDYRINKEHAHTGSIQTHFSTIGRLNSIINKNSMGNIIYSKKNTYKTWDQTDKGIVQETFKTVNREISQYSNKNPDLLSSTIIYHPNELVETKIFKGGLNETIRYESRDFYTGEPLETTRIIGDLTLKEVAVPAHSIYLGMGSKIVSASNKNMLTQSAGNQMYIKDGADWEMLSSSVQTWESDWDYIDPVTGDPDNSELSLIWRKHKTFSWKGDVTEDGYYKDFDATKEFDYSSTDAVNKGKGWRKVSEITKYNHYSVALEAKDINNKYAATRMDMDEKKVMATVDNADYQSFLYAGFEELEEYAGSIYWAGNITGDGSRIESKENSHTGNYYLSVPATGLTISMDKMEKDRLYRASVWVRGNSPASTTLSVKSPLCGIPEDGSKSIRRDSERAVKMGNWYLLNITFKADDDCYLSIRNEGGSGNIFIDDLRVHPVDAPMQSYAYDQKTGLVTAILNNENFATKFVYDDAGRLMETYKETPAGFKKISEHDYAYARIFKLECINLTARYVGSPSDNLEIIAEIKNTNGFEITKDIVLDIDHRPQVVIPNVTFAPNETKIFTEDIGSYVYCEIKTGTLNVDNYSIQNFEIPICQCPANIDIVESAHIEYIDDDADGGINFEFRVRNLGCESGGGDLSVILQEKVNGTFVEFDRHNGVIYSNNPPSSLIIEPCNENRIVGYIALTKPLLDGTYRLLYLCGSQQGISEELVIVKDGSGGDDPPPPATLTGFEIMVENYGSGEQLSITVQDGVIRCDVECSGGVGIYDVILEWGTDRHYIDNTDYPILIPVQYSGNVEVWVRVEYNGIIITKSVWIDYTVQ